MGPVTTPTRTLATILVQQIRKFLKENALNSITELTHFCIISAKSDNFSRNGRCFYNNCQYRSVQKSILTSFIWLFQNEPTFQSHATRLNLGLLMIIVVDGQCCELCEKPKCVIQNWSKIVLTHFNNRLIFNGIAAWTKTNKWFPSQWTKTVEATRSRQQTDLSEKLKRDELMKYDLFSLVAAEWTQTKMIEAPRNKTQRLLHMNRFHSSSIARDNICVDVGATHYHLVTQVA